MLEEVAHGFTQTEIVRVADLQALEPPPRDSLTLELEDRASDLVGMDHQAGRIKHDDAVLARLDDLLGLGLLLEHHVDAAALDRDGSLAGECAQKLPLVDR